MHLFQSFHQNMQMVQEISSQMVKTAISLRPEVWSFAEAIEKAAAGDMTSVMGKRVTKRHMNFLLNRFQKVVLRHFRMYYHRNKGLVRKISSIAYFCTAICF